jgi:very-short-patch-repair endonuclease
MKNRLTPLAKELRKNQTDAEKLLWRHLRSKQLSGLRFRRQHPIGNYIVDFVCLEKMLIIEVDGIHHAGEENDRKRDAWLQKEGFTVLRFWNNNVLMNLNGVMEVIFQNCTSPSPQSPPLKGGEDHTLSILGAGNRAARPSLLPSPLRGEGQGGGEQ